MELHEWFYSDNTFCELAIIEDDYLAMVDRIIEEIKEVADILEIDCDITKDDIFTWSSFEEINKRAKNDGDTPDTDRKSDLEDNNSKEHIRHLFS